MRWDCVPTVLGKYHPHGDQSIYDALVRLAQDFSLRYPVISGQGNFGSIDGDPPAAMRYTEARMAKLAEEMLKDINKNTVDFGPNYDDSMQEPLVLPGAFPFLLANGSSGIAVGMATNMPPHNLKEIAAAIAVLIDNPKIKDKELLNFIKGPDFPTGGIICGTQGIKEAFQTGRGKIIIRARVVLETLRGGKDAIIITEIPYQVNKSNLIVKIADMVKNRVIDGITDLRDESDRNGIRIVIEMRRGAIPKIILNQLFTNTPLQVAYNVNNIALVEGKPKLCDLKDLISCFIDHRKQVVIRRSKYDLQKALEREHILIGLKTALDNIDEVIKIIKQSKTVEIARKNLMQRFKFSHIQAQAILDMRLQKLTSLETQKIIEELEEVRKLIAYLKDLLASEKKILNIVKTETAEIAKKYGDERKTEIVEAEVEKLDIEDLIVKEDMVILISNNGFIKRLPLSSYKRQNRGGKGSSSSKLKEEDFITQIIIASTHDYILFITSEGKAYWLKVHEIPEGSKISRGQHIKTLLALAEEEDITTCASLTEFSDNTYVFMVTAKGVVKKVTTGDFANARQRGIIAINLDEKDKLIGANLSQGSEDIVLITRNGFALRFSEKSVRSMGRNSRGVTGIRLSANDVVIAALNVQKEEEMVVISEKGYGKRILFDNFKAHGRATKGQVCYKTNEKTGKLASALSIQKKDDLICITSQGNAIKVKLKSIPLMGKAAIGVHIVNIMEDDYVVGIARDEKE
jgi:DNA gyrase subunit A